MFDEYSSLQRTGEYDSVYMKYADTGTKHHIISLVCGSKQTDPHKYEVEPGGCSLGLRSSIETQLQLGVRGGSSVDAVGRQMLESCMSRKGD